MTPTVVVPPEFHARVGTWRVQTDPGTYAFTGAMAIGGGGSMNFVDPFEVGQTAAGTATCDFPSDPYLLLDGAGDPTALLDLPHGFEPDPDYSVKVAARTFYGPGADVCTVEFFAFGETVTIRDSPSVGVAGDPVFAVTDMDFAKLESLADTPVIVTASATVRFTGQTSAQEINGNHEAYGTYIAFAFWWRVVGVDACGNRFEGPFFQTGEDPGSPWERYDPDDEAAHPTPVVLNVTPNHGLLAGGTPFEIHGSGFGVGCTVTFDGVPATDVVAVTETRITGVAPAHAAGLVDVVVTNTDGVSS